MLPTKPYDNVFDLNTEKEIAETALCFLSAIVADNYTDEEYEKIAYYICKIVDNTIEQSAYPFPQVEYTAKNRRSIGIGVTNLADWMAKNGYEYDNEEGRNAIHRLFERHSYFLHKASARLAKERGACGWIGKTKYVDGWLPVDTYSKEIDKYHSQSLIYDWESLRKEVKQYGVRFSVLEAMMPCESSSLFSDSTGGLYPIRSYDIFKQSRKGSVYFQVPGIDDYKENYQIAWDIASEDMAKVYGIVQKFTGQGISADFYHDFSKNSSIQAADMIKLMLLSAKLGMKSWYYLNFKVTSDNKTTNIDGDSESGCESCKL